jgi:copper homeostasis protein
MLLELAVFHPDSLAIARRCGVHRIELCEDYQAGGISPSSGFFGQARKEFPGPIHVMVRPRPGNFQYSAEESDWMEQAIRQFSNAGADGFVLGCLETSGRINIRQLENLVNAAGGKPITFHRAFDETADEDEAVQTLISYGCTRILTSGRADSAVAGKIRLENNIRSYGNRICILAGGGIRSNNIEELMNISGLKECHTAALASTHPAIADGTELMRMMEILERD